MMLSLAPKETEIISSRHAAKLLSFSSEVDLKLFVVGLEKPRRLCCSVCKSLLGCYPSQQAISNGVNGHYGAGMLSFEN